MADVPSAIAYGTAAQGQAVYGTGPTTAVWAYSPWDSTTVTPAAAAGAGTSPPTPTVTSSTIARGVTNWGTGTSTAAGSQVTITFSATLPSTPVVVIAPTTSATGTLTPYVASTSTTGFTVGCVTAPTASQGATVYGVNWYLSL